MKKDLLRVYDKKDKYANTMECYFVILPENYNDRDIEILLSQITGMGWQDYTSYIIGEADIDKSEEYWSEITGYELKECKIDINRVTIKHNYKLPEYMLRFRPTFIQE